MWAGAGNRVEPEVGPSTGGGSRDSTCHEPFSKWHTAPPTDSCAFSVSPPGAPSRVRSRRFVAATSSSKGAGSDTGEVTLWPDALTKAQEECLVKLRTGWEGSRTAGYFRKSLFFCFIERDSAEPIQPWFTSRSTPSLSDTLIYLSPLLLNQTESAPSVNIFATLCLNCVLPALLFALLYSPTDPNIASGPHYKSATEAILAPILFSDSKLFSGLYPPARPPFFCHRVKAIQLFEASKWRHMEKCVPMTLK